MSTQPTQELVLPDMDPEILEAEAEDFYNILSDLSSGESDTIGWRDVAIGTYGPGDLLWAKTISSRSREGEPISPNFAFKLRFNDQFTTTVYFPTSHKNPNARRMRMDELLKTLARLCGPDFKSVPPPDVDKGYNLRAKCVYLDTLGQVAVQKSPRIMARWVNSPFKDSVTGEMVENKKVVITRAA